MSCSTPVRAMRAIISLTAIVVALAVSSASTYAQQQIQPVALPTFLAALMGPVLDVRSSGDCAENVALRRSAVRIPYDGYGTSGDARAMADEAFLERVTLSARLATARRTRSIILVVCCAGSRSEAAAKFLMSRGYRTATLVDGLANQQISRRVMKR